MAEQRAFNPLVQGSTPGGALTCRFTGKRGRLWHDYLNSQPSVSREGDVVTITLNRPETRNSLSRELEMQATLDEIGASDALGVILEANGPVFSAGHNFGDMVDIELPEARSLLEVCTRMMNAIQTFLKSSSQRCMHFDCRRVPIGVGM